MIKRIFSVVVAFAFLNSSLAYAQALPAYTGKMNSGLAALIVEKINKRGFAANDPVVNATLGAVGTAAATVATGVGAGVAAGTSIAWLPLLAAAGATAVVGGLVGLAFDGVYKWIFDGESVTSPGTVIGVPPPGLLFNRPYMDAVYGGIGGYTTVTSLAEACLGYAGIQVSFRNDEGSPYQMRGIPSSDGVSCDVYLRSLSSNAGEYLYGKFHSANGNSVDLVTSIGGVISTPTKTSYAIFNVPESEKVKAANPQLLAETANHLWQQAAAMPGYQGVPYSNSDPITVADVQAWSAANPSAVPTVGDMLAPVSPNSQAPWPSGQSVPFSPTSSSEPFPDSSGNPASSPVTNPDNKIDLGEDPKISPPGLESIPTAQMILSPIFNLLPDFKSFVMPDHNSECPKPQLDLFGRQLILDTHCGILDSIRPVLIALMTFVWVMIAAFIVLSA